MNKCRFLFMRLLKLMGLVNTFIVCNITIYTMRLIKSDEQINWDVQMKRDVIRSIHYVLIYYKSTYELFLEHKINFQALKKLGSN